MTKDGFYPILKVACARTNEFNREPCVELFWLVNIGLPVGFVLVSTGYHEEHFYVYLHKEESDTEMLVIRMNVNYGEYTRSLFEQERTSI